MMSAQSLCVFTIILPLLSVFSTVPDPSDSTNKAYSRFLETNIASFADAHYDRLMCPEDLSLVYRWDLLHGCEVNITQRSDIASNRARYISESDRFKSWFPTLSSQSQELPPLKSYWPMNKEILRDNQRLFVFGITGETTNESNPKQEFYRLIATIQNTTLPVSPDHMNIVFGGEESLKYQLINHCGLLNQSMVNSGTHIPTPRVQDEMIKFIDNALQLIKEVDLQLHEALNKVIAVITPYEVDEAMDINIAGSFLNMIGLIWLNPNVEWTTPLLAENIVHESIHNALYLAEMIHGTVTDREASDDVKIISAIRQEPRPFSKSLHAAYVSAGLCFFHLHALQTPHIPHDEHLSRLIDLFSTLPSSVDEMVEVQSKTSVLSPSGETILQHLSDLVTLLQPHVHHHKQHHEQHHEQQYNELREADSEDKPVP